jgi:hypothetical protein
MQFNFFVSSPALTVEESADQSVLLSAPVEIDATMLERVGGGGPAGTWAEAAVYDGPAGTW